MHDDDRQGSDELGQTFQRLVSADLPALRELTLRHVKIVSVEWQTLGTEVVDR